MARVLAIDFGTKRTGIAVTDEMQIIASGLTTVQTKDLLTFVTDYCKNEKVETIVVGEPKQMNNQVSESEQHIQQFLEQLHTALPAIAVERVDERFTSKMAFQTMLDSGLKKGQRKNKGLIDEISATIILQTYLEGKSKF